jgi:hypothetical protein
MAGGGVVTVRVFLQIMMSPMMAPGSQAPETRPPFPTASLFGLCALLNVHLASEASASFIFLVPVFGPIAFPVLTELRAEGFWKEQEHKIITAPGQIFFDDLAVFMFDQMPIRTSSFTPHTERKEKRQVAKSFAPQLAAGNDNTKIERT